MIRELSNSAKQGLGQREVSDWAFRDGGVSIWVEDIVAKMPGYKMAKQEMEFHDIQVCGDWASEWATNINWCSHRTGSRSSKATARWSWCRISRLTARGKFSKRCRTRRRNPESRARKQGEVEWT